MTPSIKYQPSSENYLNTLRLQSHYHRAVLLGAARASKDWRALREKPVVPWNRKKKKERWHVPAHLQFFQNDHINLLRGGQFTARAMKRHGWDATATYTYWSLTNWLSGQVTALCARVTNSYPILSGLFFLDTARIRSSLSAWRKSTTMSLRKRRTSAW